MREPLYGDVCGYSNTGIQRLINDAKKMERELADYAALRAHAERLAKALANVQYGGDDECIECGHTQCCDAECTINNALTLYRAENPKV